MAVGPKYLALTNEERRAADAIEGQIDQALVKKAYSSELGRGSISVAFGKDYCDIQKPPNWRVRVELAARYVRAGWRKYEEGTSEITLYE